MLTSKSEKESQATDCCFFFVKDTPNDRYSTDSIFLEDESLALPPRLSTMLKGMCIVKEGITRYSHTQARSPPSAYTGPISGDSSGVASYRATHLLL